MKQGETGPCRLQGTCEAEAMLPRLVGQVVTHKHGEKPFTSMRGEASCQGVPHWWSGLETVPSGGLQWADDSSVAHPPHCTFTLGLLSALCLGRLAWLPMVVVPWGSTCLVLPCADTHIYTDLPAAYNSIQPCLKKGTTELIKKNYIKLIVTKCK